MTKVFQSCLTLVECNLITRSSWFVNECLVVFSLFTWASSSYQYLQQFSIQLVAFNTHKGWCMDGIDSSCATRMNTMLCYSLLRCFVECLTSRSTIEQFYRRMMQYTFQPIVSHGSVDRQLAIMHQETKQCVNKGTEREDCKLVNIAQYNTCGGV